MDKVLIKKEVEVSLEWLEYLLSENGKNMTQVSMYSELAITKTIFLKITCAVKENSLNVIKTYIVKFPPLCMDCRNEKSDYDYHPDWSAYDEARDKILTLCRGIVGWDNVLVSDHWSVMR